MNARTRGLLVLLAKVVLATALITWLIRSGALDFRALGVLFQKPWLLAMDIVIFVIGVALATMRWRMLLSLTQVEIPFGRALQLQLTALFFNVVIPGNIGGDLVKALYAAREAGAEKRTNILLIAFAERLLGLAGLVLIASVVTLVRAPTLWPNPALRQLGIVVVLLGAASILGPLVFVVGLRAAGERISVWTSGPSIFSRLTKQLFGAIQLVASRPEKLLGALLMSMAMHCASMIFFTALTPVITAQEVPFSQIATIYPLGMLTLVLPISPAGLGVGHVAFRRLFETIGLHGGATVFNVFLIAQIAPCLLGIFPYLALKRRGDLPTEERDLHPEG